MKTHDRSLIRRLRSSVAPAAAALVLAALGSPAGAAVTLAPTLPGQYAAGTGANATFLSIGPWQNSKVFWNENTKTFSNQGGRDFAPVKSYSWGTGIWGLSDWWMVNNTSSVPIVHSWTGVVQTIDQADIEYATSGYEAKWGKVGSLPDGFFGTEAQQDNWTSRYTGYIRIAQAGEYNFGVMYDDGFFLNIFGADGSSVGISSDFLSPRERLGFDENLYMTPGLYRFELGAYDRLEVGVVNLAWLLNGKWTTVPTENLVTDPLAAPTPNPPVAVPTPGTAPLLLAALAAFAAVRMKRKRG